MSADSGTYRRQTAPVKLLGGKRPTEAAGLTPGFGLAQTLPASWTRGRSLIELVRQIRDYNADASKAVSNILRLANPGWSVSVLKAGSDAADSVGQRMVDSLIRQEFIDPVFGLEYGGGLDVLIDMVHLSAATQGAAAMEIELNDSVDQVVDFVIVNPWLIDFLRDPESRRWVPGIRKLGSFEALHSLQFKYIPVDPEPGNPLGRNPFWSALDVIFFQMEVLRDLRAAAHFSGYPRIDISVAWESVLRVIEESRPDLLEPGQSEALRDYLDEYLGDIESLIGSLNPDDAFIHFDSVTSQFIVPSGKAISTDELTAAIDAQIISGLKQLPVLLGRNEGATTTHATVQWQVYVRELMAFQRISSRLMSWALSFWLRIQGRQSIAVVEYEKLRTVDRESEARAEQMETTTKLLQVQAGWIDNDEAAISVVGHPASGEPAPVPEPPPEPDSESEPESESLVHSHVYDRSALLEEIRNLPIWQQSLYRDGEDAAWALQRDQVLRAWRRMETTLAEVPESELEEPADSDRAASAETVPSILGDNGRYEKSESD